MVIILEIYFIDFAHDDGQKLHGVKVNIKINSVA